MIQHQYIERDSGRVVTERLFGDHMVRLLYHRVRESNPALFGMLTSSRSSHILSYVNFDRPLFSKRSFVADSGIDLKECLDPPERLDTPRRIFERKIHYREFRPMPVEQDAVVSPADARVLLGSFREFSLLFLKEKFFSFEELLGSGNSVWHKAFFGGDFAVFRLTPDKYHYNHTPVSGVVVDFYAIDGSYHSCNPSAVVSMATPYSKNKRVVTIIDTDQPGGTGVGLVAMIEVVALMIGDIVQAYSSKGYDNPQQISTGMFIDKGVPKSMYRPGSSTDILIFQEGRIDFAADLLENMRKTNVSSRFSNGFQKPLVETDIRVRSLLGRARTCQHRSEP
ncbi:MAG: phosphatidylserine decarboxylase [Desulfuromonadales bacterium]